MCGSIEFLLLNITYQSGLRCIYHELDRSDVKKNSTTFSLRLDLRNKVCQNMRLYETKRKERDIQGVSKLGVTLMLQELKFIL